MEEWDAVEALVGPVEDPRDLGGSDRSRVTRVRAGGSSYVVKQYVGPDASWAREAAALEALDGTAAPRLVALDADRRLLVMEDLGGRGNLADALLGEDPARASRDLDRWVDAVAALHRAGTPELTSAFARRLEELAPGEPLDDTAAWLATGVERYAVCLPEVDVDPGDALDVLLGLPDLLSGSRVLSPCDACPDNNLVAADGMRLIDFEGASVRHPAWDLAYLRVPWPTCWCSWALPGAVADAAVERYLAAAPGLVTPDDLRVATLAWAVASPGWFLPRALHPEDGEDDDPRIPARRQMVQHRLAVAARTDGPTALTAFARRLHDRLAEEWGQVLLPLGPAWRSGG